MFDIPCIPTSASEPDSQSPSSPPASAPKPQSAEPAPLRSAAGLLALQTLPAIGEQTALRLALLANEADPLPGEHAQLWARGLGEVEEEIERCKATGIAVISIFDSAYPPRLRAIENPPPVLYVQGEMGVLERAVAFAGTREPSRAALAATERIAAALAASRWVVIGGLGKGVEAAAHRAALSRGAPTLAVLPCGFDRIPKQGEELAEAILAAGGTLLSSFRMELGPSRSTRIAAGRVETGLANVLIITHASLADGAMHMARDAPPQRRPVFCLEPGAGGEEEDGLTALLESPANRLHELLAAWKGRGHLSAQLGEQPLAKPLDPDDPAGLLAALEQASAAAPAAASEPSWPQRKS